MGRSVSTPTDARHVVYQSFECEDDDCASYVFRFKLGDLRDALCATFASVSPDDRWLDREDRAIAGNSFAYFGVSEYYGLVAIWVVPKEPDWCERPGWEGLRDRWIDSIGPKFTATVSGVFGQDLVKQGTFSNGEAFFQPKNGQHKGAMGLGFSSKEGWL
jgi:hypothetical protein